MGSRVKGQRRKRPAPQPIPKIHADAMRDVCLLDTNRSRGARDYALIILMLHGLRVGEVRQVRAQDLELFEEKPALMVKFAKGGRDRRVPLAPDAVRALKVQLMDARGDLRQEGPVFPSHTDPTVAMFERAVQRMVKRRAQQANVPDASKMHPHRFRHTFAAGYLRRGGNINALQKLLGHAHLETTAEYLNIVPDEVDQDARETGML